MRIKRTTFTILSAGALLALQSCNGIMGGIYDEPPTETMETVAGQLYIDASDWTEWHYIDFKALATAVAEDDCFNPTSLWVTEKIPAAIEEEGDGKSGIYTYWYDVFGAGISVNEFRDFTPGPSQPEPESWTIAVHRNNVRTKGCTVAPTDFSSVDDVPANKHYLNSLSYAGDTWNETDVWSVQDKMLLGLIGNQGIAINSVLSSWLTIKIPPMPPAFSLNNQVFVMRLPDGTHAALQLENYQSATGVKCCLTINYRYPL